MKKYYTDITALIGKKNNSSEASSPSISVPVIHLNFNAPAEKKKRKYR